MLLLRSLIRRLSRLWRLRKNSPDVERRGGNYLSFFNTSNVRTWFFLAIEIRDEFENLPNGPADLYGSF